MSLLWLRLLLWHGFDLAQEFLHAMGVAKKRERERRGLGSHITIYIFIIFFLAVPVAYGSSQAMD